MIDFDKLNAIINKSQENNYKVVKYLGNNKKTENYLLNDVKGNYFICKSRENKYPLIQQTAFELALNKYLSTKPNINKYINPYIFKTQDDKNIYVIYPIIKGISLQKMRHNLNEMDSKKAFLIKTYIIKHMLEALANIHEIQIAHNSLDDTSIIIDISSPSKLGIKFTDFYQGCGKYLKSLEKDNEKDQETANSSKNKYLFQKCDDYQSQIFENLTNNHKYLPESVKIIDESKKWDLWCMAILCLELLLGDTLPWNKFKSFYKLNNQNNNILDFKNIYFNSIKKYIENKNNKVLSKYVNHILQAMMINPEKYNNPARYALEKIIIFEKYKNY